MVSENGPNPQPRAVPKEGYAPVRTVPIQRLEKHVEQAGVPTQAIRELVNATRTNQRAVEEIVKLNTEMIRRVSDLASNVSELTTRVNDLISHGRAAEPSEEKARYKEFETAYSQRLDKLEKRLNTLIVAIMTRRRIPQPSPMM
jgi:outer membrane murein-binding lipoprotein Lpp